jgi:hypothetical protein
VALRRLFHREVALGMVRVHHQGKDLFRVHRQGRVQALQEKIRVHHQEIVEGCCRRADFQGSPLGRIRVSREVNLYES